MRRCLAAAAVVAIGLALAIEPTAAQCAMCRRALDSPEGQQLVGALRRGILVLFAAPFLLFGVVATLAIRSQRRHTSGDTLGAGHTSLSGSDRTAGS